MGNRSENFYPGTTTPLASPDVISRIQQETDVVLVALSYGKDAMGMLLHLRKFMPPEKMVLMYREVVPGLQFVQRRLAYYEDKLQQPIHRVTSAHFYRMLREGVYQTPERMMMIEALHVPKLDFDDINLMLWESLGYHKDHLWCAVGVRAADSSQRRAACYHGGPINWKDRVFWAGWDLSNEDVGTLLREHGIGLAMDYKIWGTSFDGLRNFWVSRIKERYPEDYETIKFWFPLIDLDRARRTLRPQLERVILEEEK